MGVFVNLTEGKNIVTLYGVNKLNFDSALDRSRKLVMDKKAQLIRFKTDFGQKNYIKLKENSETKRVDSVSFELDNHALAAEHDILTINAETTEVAEFAIRGIIGGSKTYYTANLEAYSTFDGVSKKDIGVRLVKFTDNEYGGYVSDGNENYYLDLMVKRVGVDEMIADAYKPLFERMFSKLRVVEATFMLNAQDISKFNQLVPVYVDYYGAYFFVNKISNWIAGKPCKVELVKL
jgi:hypothetical protein